MGLECNTSFADLFRLARRRGWTADEERHFQQLNQPQRNTVVKEMAAEAGCIDTEDRIGSDGLIYTAFWIRPGTHQAG